MSPIRALLAEPIAAWRRGTWPWRMAYAIGVALMCVGLMHGIAWLFVGGAWDGQVSFRKPFSFGLSFGLTTITLAWVADRLGLGHATGRALLPALAVANTLEVVWVSAQRARGVASHFNLATPLDTALYIAMGAGAITVSAIVVIAMTVVALRRRTDDPALTLAIRAGLVLLLTAMIGGGAMISVGNVRAAAGQTHDLVQWGAAGNMKVTHAIGLHGVQVLSGLALWLSATAMQAAGRTRVVATAALAYGGLLTAGTLQWLDGRPLTQPGPVDGILGLVSIVTLAAVAVTAFRAPRSTAFATTTDS